MPGGEGAVGGGTYPRLAGNPDLASWRKVAVIVLMGSANMPAFGAPQGRAIAPRTALLSDAEIASVTNYVRTHFGNHYRDRATARDVGLLPHPSVPAYP